MLGLDYAGGRPGGAAIKAAGYGFVVRYLSDGGAGLPGKLLTAAEYGDLMAHGIAVVANWETTADRMLGGYSAGQYDATAADAQLRRAGHPPGRPIYFSADWDATPAQQAEIDDYLRGAISVLSLDRVGVYGSYYVVRRCLDNHTARWAWQTGAWSGGQREPRAHLYQRIGTVVIGGVECDVNEALAEDFGQGPHPTEEEIMPSPAEIWNHPIEDPYVSPDGVKAVPKTAGVLLGWAATHAAYARAEAAGARAAIAELARQVDAGEAEIDTDALVARLTEATKAALASGVLDVDISVHDKTGGSA